MRETLSVVVPVYNAEKYLEKCIQSILNQTYKNIELILVNDGSKDHSLDICYLYEKRYSNVTVINKKNEGVIAARKAGIEKAEGKWISFVDSDDWIESDMYEKLFFQLEVSDAQISVLGDYTIRSIRSNMETEITAEKALKLLCQMQFVTSMCMAVYPMMLVKEVKTFSDIHFFEDFLFNYIVLHKVSKVAVCHGQFYHYTNNPESVNHRKINEKRMSCLKIIPKILCGGELYDEKLKKEIPYAVAHFLICNIIFLNKDCSTYNKQLKQACSIYGGIVQHSKNVPWIYKFLICICGRSPEVVSYLVLLKNKLGVFRKG